MAEDAAAQHIGAEIGGRDLREPGGIGKELRRGRRPRLESGRGVEIGEGLVAQLHEAAFDLVAPLVAIGGREQLDRLEPAPGAHQRVGLAHHVRVLRVGPALAGVGLAAARRVALRALPQQAAHRLPLRDLTAQG